MSKITREDAQVEELIKVCFAEAYHFLKAEGRKTTTRNADIVPHYRPEDDAKDAIPPLVNKKQRLEDWLRSTFKMKRVVTNETNIPNQDEVDDDCDYDDNGIMDPYVTVRVEDIESIDGKTDKSGMPFGKCALTLRNGDDLFGSWREGRRSATKYIKKKIIQNDKGGAGKQLGSEAGSHSGYPPDKGSLHQG